MILMFSYYLHDLFIRDFKQLLINNRLFCKKYHNVKLIAIHLIVGVIFSIGCFLHNLSEEMTPFGVDVLFAVVSLHQGP